jgi:hypothetical protein
MIYGLVMSCLIYLLYHECPLLTSDGNARNPSPYSHDPVMKGNRKGLLLPLQTGFFLKAFKGKRQQIKMGD